MTRAPFRVVLSVSLFFFMCELASAVSIEMVTVGNPGNAPSGTIGSVAYVYQIGKYEVTANQYTEFLNAVAKDDPNGLYNPAMVGAANIQRSGSSPNFSYSVASDWANRPIGNVGFWDAARFANWLHNGQPIGLQGPGTTETGAYHDVGNQTLFGRNSGAKFFIPSEDEWYKAAYHNKSAGLAASYFLYPTGTDSIPGRDVTESTNPGNNANYFSGDYLIGSPYFRTLSGEFESSDSPYGTFDQGGNVWEWNERADSQFGGVRSLRGSSYADSSSNMRRSNPISETPTTESSTFGFRVAGIPNSANDGDFNGDGSVNAADYVVWRKNNGAAAEYAKWRSHFGLPAGAGSGTGGTPGYIGFTVSEPASALMLLVFGVVHWMRRRCRIA